MPIRKTLLSLAACALTALAAPAQAGMYEFDFTATGFGPSVFNRPAPQSTISGSIIFTASDSPFAEEAVTVNSISLIIGGHAYTAAEVGGVVGANNNYYSFGALVGSNNPNVPGYSSVQGGINDFFVSFSFGTLLQTTYSVQSNIPDQWSAFNFNTTATVTPYVASDVPEPASAALVLLGLGAAGLGARRRKHKA
jgi:hypothetical protein